jgi:hypothetical protein
VKIYKDNKTLLQYCNDYIPITHTIECHIPKRTNRISREVGKHITKLYIDEDKSIEEISTITGKSVERVNRYLAENKLL